MRGVLLDPIKIGGPVTRDAGRRAARNGANKALRRLTGVSQGGLKTDRSEAWDWVQGGVGEEVPLYYPREGKKVIV